ncbi:MAG: YebC/PmpR family DNA-binding transcriptional regulator [Mycoplasmataceae bacterium]|jgi:YebC/PmpR family DNA-binding regulatory protein|nr:YebC/PmpR family DNA-binding transcriptional regulator [Mycoplasmataceae bacterium]
MPRDHLIASTIAKKQQLQSKIWQKLAREIKTAVKVGGSNIDANPRLKAAIDKGLQNNLSRESIEKNINGSNKDPNEMTSLEYECYGPNGIQIIVTALTDNTNRTASNLRGYLSKLHGEIAKANSVKIFFDNLGVIVLYKNIGQSKDNIEEIILNNNVNGYIDTNESNEIFTVNTESNDNFYKIKELLLNKGYSLIEAAIKLVAQNKVTKLDDENKARLERFIDACDQDEDIQTVVTNYEETCNC